MKMMIALALTALAMPAASFAQSTQSEISPTPGASAILRADLINAERELRSVPAAERDVARSINLGIVLAKMGQTDEAARRFYRVIVQDDVELILADGQIAGSQDVARRALAAMKRGEFSR